MIPARIIELAALPMTTSGKVDRKNLPAVDWSAAEAREIVQAESDAELALVQVFSKVLNIEQVSRFDNFYALGGDSVSALRMASLLRSRGYELSQTALIKNPQLNKLAKEVHPLGKPEIESEITTEPFTLAPIQHWFEKLNFSNPGFYHQSLELQTKEPLDVAALQTALNAVIAYHDQLRMYFPEAKSGMQQIAAAKATNCKIDYHDLTTATENIEQQRQQIALNLREQLQLNTALLIRAAVIKLDEVTHDIVLVVHHAAVDTVSWHIIGQDLFAAYQQIREGKEPRFAAKTSSYYRWSTSLHALFQEAVAEKYLDLWNKELTLRNRKMVRTLSSATTCKTGTMKCSSLELNAGLTESLVNHCNSAFSTTTEEMLLAAVYQALALWMDRRDLCIDLEWHGRNSFGMQGLDISNTVGWFTAIYPLALRIEKGEGIQQTLLNLKEVRRTKTCKGASFSALRYLAQSPKVRQAFANYAAPDIVFNYSGIVDSSHTGSKGEWEILPISAVESAAENVTPYPLAIEALIRNGKLHFELYFHEHYCDSKAVEQLLELIGFGLRSLITICENQKVIQRTPSDFPLASISSCEARDLPASTANVLPLSDIQTGILLQVKSAPESQMYHVQVLYEFDKPLNKAAFSRALDIVVKRHDALRTRFVSERAVPLQIIDNAITAAVEFIDFSNIADAQLEVRFNDFIAEDGKQLFNLEEGPLFRVHVFSLKNSQTFRMLLNVHHLIHDGWSLAILMDEFSAVYDLFQRDPELSADLIEKSLPEVQANYADYILAQKTCVIDREHQQFWQEQAAKLVEFEHASFPADHIAHADNAKDNSGSRCEISVRHIDPELYVELKRCAQAHGVTLNSLLFTGFTLFLRTIKQSDQLITGVVTSGRTDRVPGSDSIIGCCLNTLPVAVSLEQNPALGDVLQGIHSQLADVIDKCMFPLSEIANIARKISGDSELTQLFDCTYDFESYRYVAEGEDNRPRMIGGYEMTNYGMEINILEEQDSLSYRFTFDPAQYKTSTIDRWMQYFETLLAQITRTNSADRISDISAIPDSEIQTLMTLSGFQADYAENRSVYHFVEKHALEQAHNIAVQDAQQQLTYKELNERANRIAGVLMENGVQQDAPVAVLLERSVDFIAAVIAIWKCGAAYMPIDPEYPLERVNTLIENARAELTISTKVILQSFESLAGTRVIYIDDAAVENYSTADINLVFKPDNLAYVLFTSGSTGTPKGVMIEHRGMMNNIQSEVNDFFLDQNSVIAQTASQCFDVSVWQCFAGLSVGAKICIYSKELQLDPESFIQQCFERDKVTNLQLVPSYVNELMNFLEEQAPDLSQLRMLSITGEALKLPLLKRWLSLFPNIPVINAYGPAEASDDITHHVFREIPQDGIIPIGKPTQNANIYILDAQQKLCPRGIVGEICVSGVCVGRGYIHDEERTQASFGTDPVRGDATRFYRTGDLGRWRDDGVLEFYGRKDYQVKVNGFRVELGEIENQLAAHSALTEVAVVMHKQPGSEQRTLTAFVSAVSAVDETELRNWLAERVPGHMVPARFVILDKLPTNTSGKLDKKRLQSWSFKTAADKALNVGENAKQKMLREALQAVFKTEEFDPAASFFAVGGDSLKAIQLISKIKSLGGKLGVQNVFVRPRFADLAECIELANADEQKIKPEASLSVSGKQHIDVAALLPAGDRDLVYGGHQNLFELDNIDIAYPLSSLQEGMLFHHMLDEEGAYLGRYILELHGTLDLDALENALNSILDKHEALRTGFIYQRVSRPLQVVLKKRHTSIRRYDISALAAESVSGWLDNFYEREALTPFDLGSDVLMRISAIKLAETHYQLFVTSHHIVMDGWSVANLVQDLLQFYGAEIGRANSADKQGAAFRNYIAWLAGQNKQAALQAFNNYLQAYEPVSLRLPHAVPGTKASGSVIENQELGLRQYVVQFGNTLSADLNTCARKLEVTPNAVFRVLWGLALQRYTYARDVVFGNVISGRFPEIENVNAIVGSLINTLPVRIQCTGEETVASLIQGTQRAFVEMEKHGHLALADIQKASALQEPLFDHILVSDNFPIDLAQLNTQAKPLGFSFDRIEGGAQTNYDLTVLVTTGNNLTVTFEYKPEAFAEEQLSCVGQHLRNLAQQICANPQQAVNELRLLDDTEFEHIVSRLSQGEDALIPEQGLLAQMQAVFSQYANKAALLYKGEQKTFAEVDRISTALAGKLTAAGVGKNCVVPLIAERSFEMVTAIVAILKAGGAWLPIDPSLPEERINFILNDVDPAVVLVWDANWKETHQTHIEKTVELIDLHSVENLSQPQTFARESDSLTYIIYTSGSTGAPKGVMIEDAALLNRLAWMASNFDISSKDTILQKTVFTFDVSVWELLLPFLTGASMSLLEQGAERVPAKIVAQIETDKVSVLHFVPSMLYAFTQEMPNINSLQTKTASLVCCFTSGEALNPHQAEAFFSFFPKVALHNLYGPTEAAIDVSDYTVQRGDTRIPIGKPVNGTQLYIFDVFNQPAPMGIPGELLIGGVQLGRGYHNRPVLSSEKFSRGLFDDGRIVYKTGDLSSWLEDGNIAYHGRMDHQVKIRGFRIEPGEIENRLCQHKHIQDAVVLATDNNAGTKQLLAFIVSHIVTPADSQPELSADQLRSWLAEFLPAYMIPADFIPVASIPQTANGKVDRRALLALAEERRIQSIELTPPETELQGVLLRVWQEVLNTEAIGIDDNFFSVRGDSILAIQIASRIQNFGYRFNVEDIFQHPSIRRLAEVLEPLNEEIDQAEFVGKIAATPVQLWFADKVKTDRHHWNQSIVLNAQHIDLEVASKALAILCKHHDVLRSKVEFGSDDEPVLFIDSSDACCGPTVQFIETGDIDTANTGALALQSSLNLEEGAVLKALLLRQGPVDKLLLVAHHLVIDGVSWRILLEDFVNIYQTLASNKPVNLPPKTHSFAYWRDALSEFSNKKKLRAEAAYWTAVETMPVDVITERADFGTASQANVLEFQLDIAQTQRLSGEASLAYNTKVNELVLSALAIALGQWKQLDALKLDLETHGREKISSNLDVTRTVGWFTAVFPVVLNCVNTTALGQHIKSVKELLRGVPANGVGYGVLRYLTKALTQPASGRSHILFNYLGQIGDISAAGFDISSEYSAFDVSEKSELLYPLEIACLVEQSRFRLKLIYSTSCFTASEVEALLSALESSLNAVINHCCSQEDTSYTPSDFSDGDIDMDELDAILEAIE